jgi:hypothetical protein
MFTGTFLAFFEEHDFMRQAIRLDGRVDRVLALASGATQVRISYQVGTSRHAFYWQPHPLLARWNTPAEDDVVPVVYNPYQQPVARLGQLWQVYPATSLMLAIGLAGLTLFAVRAVLSRKLVQPGQDNSS